MTTIDEIIRGLQIFKHYIGGEEIDFQHDECYAGPEPSLVREQDLAELKELGWHASEEHSCFYHFS